MSGRPFIVALLDPAAPCHDDCQHPDLDHRTAGQPCQSRGGLTLRDPAIITREAFAGLDDCDGEPGARRGARAMIERYYASYRSFGAIGVEAREAFDALTEHGATIPLPARREILVSASTYIGIVQMIEDARQRPKGPEYRSREEHTAAILRVFNAAERGESLMCEACRHTERSLCWCVRDADTVSAEVIRLADANALRRAARRTRRVVGVVIAEDPHADRGVLAQILGIDGRRHWWRQDALRPPVESQQPEGLCGGLVLVHESDAPAWASAVFAGSEGA